MRRILLVEDHEINQQLLARRLAREGYHVICAADGLEALAVTAESSPEIVLMDLSLPMLDGWEATRRLKSDGATSRIPVIALTAHAMHEDRAKAFQAGCDEFETKPVNFTRLLAKMETLLGGADVGCAL